ncbi:MAG: hypothetical protein K6E76_02600 [Patescibacteria group bacterium]|nr:hypothetical protein [Patescibacteria group bacterium]
MQENSSTIAKFFGKEKLVDAMEYVQWVDTEIKNHPVDNAEFPQVFDNTVS